MKPARVFAHDLRHCGGEGDDIVADFGFNLMDAFELEVSALADGARGCHGNHAGLG